MAEVRNLKKSIKRLISLALACVFICSGFQCVNAQKTDNRLDKARNLLSALNIVSESGDAIVTRERFADIYVRANNMYQEGYESANPFEDTTDSPYAGAIDLMRDYGIVSGVGNNCYAPSENIRTSDIAKLYVAALGFEVYAAATGKDYMEIAYEVDLFDGVNVSDYITMDNLVIMTYNFLNASVGVHDFNEDSSYRINRDTTALYEKFDIFKVTGQVVQNDLSGIWSAIGAVDGYVVIKTKDGEITALEGTSGIGAMLGRTLDIYVYEGVDEYEIISYDKRTSEMSATINIKDIDFDKTDLERITYIEEGKTTSSYERLADFPAFIVNGVYYDAGQFDFNKLKNYSGQIHLIADGSTEYDVVIIDAYTNYFVKNVEHYAGAMSVYDSGINSPLVLEESLYEKMELYHPNGAVASQYELQAGMLLSVAKSFGSNVYISINICDEVMEGTITGYDYDERVLILDKENKYYVSPSYNFTNISIGSRVKVYIDNFGSVAWIEYDRTAVLSYAYMRKACFDDDGSKVMAKVVAESGKFSTMYLAEVTEIDGLKCKSIEKQLSELETVDKIPNLPAGEYPFRYRLNDAGEIKEIDTPRVRSGYEDKYSFRVTASGADVICSNDKILGKETPLSSSTVMFLIPEATADDEREDPGFYSMGNSSLVNTGGDNTYTAFKVSNDSIYADFVIRTQKSMGGGLNHDNVLFLVEKVQDVYDENSGEVRTKVFGIEAGVKREYFIHKKCKTTKLDSLKRGNVVRFAYHSGEIASIDNVFIYNTDAQAGGGSLGNYHLPSGGQKASSLSQIGTSYYYAGYAMRREGRIIEILPFDLTASSQDTGVAVPNIPDWDVETRRVFQAPTKIAIYDPSLGTKDSVYLGDLEDIPAYEDGGHLVKVIVRYRSRSAQEMVVLKDESLFQ